MATTIVSLATAQASASADYSDKSEFLLGKPAIPSWGDHASGYDSDYVKPVDKTSQTFTEFCIALAVAMQDRRTFLSNSHAKPDRYKQIHADRKHMRLGLGKTIYILSRWSQYPCQMTMAMGHFDDRRPGFNPQPLLDICPLSICQACNEWKCPGRMQILACTCNGNSVTCRCSCSGVDLCICHEGTARAIQCRRNADPWYQLLSNDAVV